MTILTDLWAQFAIAIPTFLMALAILIVGLIAASVLSSITRKVIESMKVDDLVQSFSIFRKAESAGWKIRPSHIFANIVKWFFIIFTLLAVSDRLGLNTISEFLKDIVGYIPQVVVAIVLLAVGFVLGQFVYDIVKQSISSSSLGNQASKVAPLVAKYAIIIFAGMAAATQLGIAEDLIRTFFTAVVAALALALGLAFGLGGKEHASRVLDNLQK